MTPPDLARKWARFWLRFASPTLFGRLACELAGIPFPPYIGRVPLATVGRAKGYFPLSASIHHSNLSWGKGVFLGQRTIIYQDEGGGPVALGSDVHIHRDTIIQTGAGGSVRIGDETHIQPACRISAYCRSVIIGQRVEIAPGCSFYPYNHASVAGTPIRHQPLISRGDIVIDDDVWLGVGATILDGVHIGAGAVIGAGSVVTQDVPENSIAAGVPARIIGRRQPDGNEIERDDSAQPIPSADPS